MSMSPVRPARPWAFRCAAVAAAAWLALPAAAAPQFGVATLAAVNDPELGYYTQAGYNATFSYLAWGPQWDPLAAATSYTSPCTAALNCSAAAGTSPAGTNPDANAAQSSARLDLFPSIYPDTHGTAAASASLADGTLHAAATGQRRFTGRPILEGTDGRSAARLWETLNFHVADANPGTRTTIQVKYEVDGAYLPGDAMPNMGFNFDFGPTARIFGGSEAGGYTGGGNPGNWINPVMTWDGPGHMLFTAGYELVGEDTEIGLLMQLQTIGGFGTADFSHTAALSFDLPSNVSFTSASGVFLSATNPGGGGGNVPEPPVLALLAAAAVAVRWSRRRV